MSGVMQRGHRWAIVVSMAIVLGACSGSPRGRPLSVDAEVSVGENLPATANDVGPANANNSPLLAADPTEPRFVVMAHRLDAAEFSCALQVSGDGGRTFVAAQPVPVLPLGAERCYAPEVAFDRRGVLHYLFVGLKGQENTVMGVFLTASADRARTFAPPRPLLGPNNFGVRMAIDRAHGRNGRMHLVWIAARADPTVNSFPAPPNPILAAHSDDAGETFSRPVPVTDSTRALVVAPALSVAPGGRVHVVYYDLLNDERDYHGLEGPTWEDPWQLVSATSNNGGETFDRNVLVDANVAPPDRVLLIFTMPPASVVAGASNKVYVAWHDARNGDWDVFLRVSRDAAKTWSPARRLNDDLVANGRHQYQPRLALSPDGRIDAVFYDRRNDEDNRRNDVYYTFSPDGGASFSRNIRLTSESSDSRTGPRYLGEPRGLIEFGSRLGLISSDAGAVAAWTDTRNAPLPDYQDVFTTTIALERANT